MPPSAADVTNTYLYDPYGVTQHQTGTQYNPWQFASGYLDASTLYYKYGTRYYDRFGRWTQKDPQPSANPYLYTNDDPVNVVDPNGTSAITYLGAAFIAGITFDQVGAATLSIFFQIALVLLGGGPIGAFFAGLVLGAAFFALLGELIVFYDTVAAPECGTLQVSL